LKKTSIPVAVHYDTINQWSVRT